MNHYIINLRKMGVKKVLICSWFEQKVHFSLINSHSQCENTKKNYYNRKKRCKFAEKFKISYKIRHDR